MLNEYLIHLCDCTWLNEFSHAQFLLIKHEKIFECFSCFWKVFCFCKNCQKFQKQCCLVLATWLRVSPIACPQSRALLREYSWLIGGSKSRSRKILRKFFKIWVFRFLTTQTGNLFADGTSSCEKHLDKFFKNFILGVSQLVLATCPQLNSVAKITCFAL